MDTEPSKRLAALAAEIERLKSKGPVQVIPPYDRVTSVVRGIESYIAAVNVEALEFLPEETLRQVENSIKEFSAALETVRSQSIVQPDGQAAIDDFASGLHKRVRNAFLLMQRAIVFMGIVGGSREFLLAPLNKHEAALKQKSGQVDALLEEITSRRDELEGKVQDSLVALDKAGKLASGVGVEQSSRVFSNEASLLLFVLWFWGVITLAVATYTLRIAREFHSQASLDHDLSVGVAIQLVSTKVLIVSILSLLTVWCANQFRGTRHNRTLALHRAHSLTTFQAFLAGAHSQDVKDQLLLYAASAAYGPRSSGYEKSEELPGFNPANNTLRGVVGGLGSNGQRAD